MKIRCIKNSIRFRLKKSDLAILEDKLVISENVLLPADNKFSFGIEVNEYTLKVTAKMIKNILMVRLPKKVFEAWNNSDHISIEENIKLTEEDTLQILIEKDLPCIDRPDEDKSDTFEELVDQGKVC